MAVVRTVKNASIGSEHAALAAGARPNQEST